MLPLTFRHFAYNAKEMMPNPRDGRIRYSTRKDRKGYKRAAAPPYMFDHEVDPTTYKVVSVVKETSDLQGSRYEVWGGVAYRSVPRRHARAKRGSPHNRGTRKPHAWIGLSMELYYDLQFAIERADDMVYAEDSMMHPPTV
jgi:hypothetical protein